MGAGYAGNAYMLARAGFAGYAYMPANEAADGTTWREPVWSVSTGSVTISQTGVDYYNDNNNDDDDDNNNDDVKNIYQDTIQIKLGGTFFCLIEFLLYSILSQNRPKFEKVVFCFEVSNTWIQF